MTLSPSLKTILKIVISLSLLFYIAGQCDFSRFGKALTAARPDFLAGAMLATALFVFISVARFQVILRDQPNFKPPFSELLKNYLMGLFFSFFTPGGISGDAMRVAKLKRLGGALPMNIQSVLLERGLGFLALLTLCLPILAFGGLWKTLSVFSLWVLGSAFVLGYAGLFLLSSGLAGKLPLPVRLKANAASIRSGTVWLAMLASFVLQGVNLSVYFLVSRALRVELAFTLLVPAIVISSAAAMLPISFKGLGVSEGIFAKMLSAQGMAIETAVLLSLLVFLTGFLAGLPGGLIYCLERD